MNLEDLNKHLELVQKLQNAQELYQSLQAKSLGSQKIDGMPHGTGVSDKTGMLAVELADMSVRVAYLKEAVRESAGPVAGFINSIEEDKTRMIFRLRFLHGYAWCEVAGWLGADMTEEAVKESCYRFLRCV